MPGESEWYWYRVETFTLSDDVPIQPCDMPIQHRDGTSFQAGIRASVYYSRGGWRGFLHGVDENGDAWEGIEIGPFRSRLACIRALLNYYDEHEKEDERWIVTT